MTVRVMCSWCHTMIVVVRGAVTLCPHCGHRADVCRTDCDCLQCRRQQTTARLRAVAAQVDAAGKRGDE